MRPDGRRESLNVGQGRPSGILPLFPALFAWWLYGRLGG